MAVTEDAEDRIFKEIERVRKDIGTLGTKIDLLKDNDITDMKVELATLKVKAGVFGLVGGLIPVLIAISLQYLRSAR